MRWSLEVRLRSYPVQSTACGARVGTWTFPWDAHEDSYLLSLHRLFRTNDTMKFRDFLNVPLIRRRARSEPRNESGSIGGANRDDPGVPHPTESTPYLPVGASTSPTPDPLFSRDQESSGMQAVSSRVIHLTAGFVYRRKSPLF